MSVETLNCNECGATIQVPSTAKYCTCNRCRAHLVVHRNPLATFMEAVPPPRAPRADEPPDRDWRDMTDRLDELTYQNELMRIDREWEMERERYMVYGRYGYRHVPNTAWSVVGGIIAVVFGLFWTAMVFGVAANGPGGMGPIFPLFGVVFVAIAVGASIYNFTKAQRYNQAYNDYQARRRAVEARRWRTEPPEAPDTRDLFRRP
jgi:uncharacterized membrane protein